MTYSFIHYESGATYDLDTSKLQVIKDALGTTYDDLAELLTGLTCDSYADATEGLVLDSGGDIEVACGGDFAEEYARSLAFHRILNGNLTDEQCHEAWVRDFVATAEG